MLPEDDFCLTENELRGELARLRRTLKENLEGFTKWFQEQCWPIDPKEAKGSFDRDETIKALIEEYVNAQ